MRNLLDRLFRRQHQSVSSFARQAAQPGELTELARSAKSSEEVLEVGKEALGNGDYALANLALRAINPLTRVGEAAQPLLAESRVQLALKAAESEIAAGRKHATSFVEVLQTLEAAHAIGTDAGEGAVRQRTLGVIREYVNLRYKAEVKRSAWPSLFVLLDALERTTDDDEERAWARRELGAVAVNLAVGNLADLKQQRARFLASLGGGRT